MPKNKAMPVMETHQVIIVYFANPIAISVAITRVKVVSVGKLVGICIIEVTYFLIDSVLNTSINTFRADALVPTGTATYCSRTKSISLLF